MKGFSDKLIVSLVDFPYLGYNDAGYNPDYGTYVTGYNRGGDGNSKTSSLRRYASELHLTSTALQAINYVFPNGKRGFIPAIDQIEDIVYYEITEINNCLRACGGKEIKYSTYENGTKKHCYVSSNFTKDADVNMVLWHTSCHCVGQSNGQFDVRCEEGCLDQRFKYFFSSMSNSKLKILCSNEDY